MPTDHVDERPEGPGATGGRPAGPGGRSRGAPAGRPPGARIPVISAWIRPRHAWPTKSFRTRRGFSWHPC